MIRFTTGQTPLICVAMTTRTLPSSGLHLLTLSSWSTGRCMTECHGYLVKVERVESHNQVDSGMSTSSTIQCAK